MIWDCIMYIPFKRLLISVSIMATSVVVMGQSVQRGQVLEYQGANPKTPLAKVHIAAANASAVQSDAEGQFTLQFRTLHAGDAIQFRRVELSGYEVMNTEALEVARVARVEAVDPSDQSAQLHIVMAPRETLHRLKEGYRVVSQKRYEEQMKAAEAEIKKLRDAGQLAESQYNERMNALEEEYEEKLSKLETYIDKFARIDLSDIDQEEQHIVELVQQGKFEEALQIYEGQHLHERLQKNKADIQQLTVVRNQLDDATRRKAQENLRLRQSIDRQVTLLRMAGGEDNLRKVHQLLRDTYLADTTYFEARRDYVMSLHYYYDYETIIQLLNSGIASEADPFARGMMVIDLMSIRWEQEQYDESYRLAQRADSILSPLQQSNYAVASRALPAWSFYQLQYWMRSGEFEACQPVAERLRREWAPDTLDINSLFAYINVLTALSDYYSGVGDQAQSLWCARQSLQLGEIMEQRNPWRSVLFDACANACSTFLMEGLRTEACQSARRCLTLLAERLKRGSAPSVYANVFSACNTLMQALVPAGEYALADSVAQWMQDHYVLNHLRLDDSLSRLHLSLYQYYQAQVLLHKGQSTDAEALSIKALQTMEESEEGADLTVYLRPEWEARLALSQGQYSSAAKACQKAIKVCCDLYKESEDAWDADNVCRYYLLLAEIHLASGKSGKAKKTLQEAEKYAAFESNRQDISALRWKQ